VAVKWGNSKKKILDLENKLCYYIYTSKGVYFFALSARKNPVREAAPAGETAAAQSSRRRRENQEVPI